ncbi:hypothetical protein QBC46DRAFT_452540 [Diplogelasinospora grovesii]|uniref:Uncharacterized protein n=1 Tax=Diplogelasinospora grovesii TaxID=303347 RepID=A0AAN6N062_9PEZI|nr:hypothetical protein QBC46DRAFT_452540 [Diplogelasinospora grovesii]
MKSLATKLSRGGCIWGPQRRRKARRHFIQNAIEATLSARHGRGMDRYYQDYTKNPRISRAISWAFLLRDTRLCHRDEALRAAADSDYHSSPDIRWRFLQHCVSVALHAFDDLATATNLDFMERTEPEFSTPPWMKGTYRQIRNMSFSPKDNIEKCISLLDCGPKPDAVPFGSFEDERIKDCLLRCPLFSHGNELDIAVVKEHIRSCTPVTYPDMERLRPVLFTLSDTEPLIACVPENDMLVFLCSCAFLHAVDAVICDWAASSEGSAIYRQTLQGFREKETMQQTSLRVLALFSFGQVPGVQDLWGAGSWRCMTDGIRTSGGSISYRDAGEDGQEQRGGEKGQGKDDQGLSKDD